MPRALKSDKFFIYAPKRSGYSKGKRLMGVNLTGDKGHKDVNLQDLLDFLKKNEIDPAKVPLPGQFTVLVNT